MLTKGQLPQGYQCVGPYMLHCDPLSHIKGPSAQEENHSMDQSNQRTRGEGDRNNGGWGSICL